ncbi:hypothetical protein [uncultured Herbaspirillum sp.]|uniref:hypothetical protein n=1 Tax=uncultured Herbaspirillum sp. TaxID=160236 RepID=UPI0025882B71|nr:hypothetical protein [uncultured Herbaspirillum sp.]
MFSFEFTIRPSSVLPDHRPLYKITQVLLVLNLASRGKQSSLIRLQLFNWVLKDSERQQKLLTASKEHQISFPAWGVDPVLNKALAFAKADGLILPVAQGFKLSLLGQQFCARVIKNGLFEEDRAFLETIGISVTQKMVDEIVNRWG